ncbi:MAG: glycosyltransferase [Chloroflexi bacterium]|nr:MAG: glycosyltransferase [Chloroflexota bacterium]
MNTTPRATAVALGIRLEVVTVVWMTVEAGVAIVAGLMARSVLLAAFGVDSVIELLSGVVLLWRLSAESRGAGMERVQRLEVSTARISAVLLVLLCVFVVVTSLVGLVAGFKPADSVLGLAVAGVAVVAMPLLAIAKSRANRAIGSASLRADIAETITCAYMAGVTLVGVGLSMAVDLWWLQYICALALLIWLVPETREAIEAARGEDREEAFVSSSEPVRILHVVTAFPRYSGDTIVPWLVELLKRLRTAGYEVEVLTSAYRGGGGQSHDGIPVHRFRYFFARWEDLTHDEAAADRMGRSVLYRVLPLFYVAGGLWASRRMARSGRFDIIHVHWPVPHVLFGWLARRASHKKARLVTSWYGAELRLVQSSMPWLRGFVRWALRTSDAVVAISSYTAREIGRFGQVPVRVIPYSLGFAAAQATGHIRDESFRILFVGRLVERKGLKHLIEAVRRLPPELKARLTVIGEGPEREALAAQIRSSGLDSSVDIRGRVPESALRDAYAESDVLVLPSIVDARGDTEGLGVVLLEAMSYGVPVVASAIGGITDIVENEESGLLVPPADADQLANALKRLALDPALAARLGAAGEQRVRTAFGWPEILQKWEECYGALLNGRADIAPLEAGASMGRGATP